MVSSLQVLALGLILSTYFRRRSPFGSVIIPFVLLLYALATGLRGIIVRACLQFFVDQTVDEEKWGWPPVVSCLITGVIGLTLIPQFGTSASYLIGWIVSGWSRALHDFKYRVFILFLLMYPTFFGLPDLLTPVYFVFWVLRPAIMFVLVLPSFLVFVFPILHFLVDPVWQCVFWLARRGDRVLPYPLNATSSRPIISFLWIELLVATVFGFFVLHRRRQRILRHSLVKSPCGS